MDKDTKTKMLLDMQEHPEQFAEQELKDMLNLSLMKKKKICQKLYSESVLMMQKKLMP